MNDNLYEVDEDIAAAEQLVQRRAEGRRLARNKIIDLNSGQSPTVTWNGTELAMVCEAAVHSGNLERIAELERNVAEYQQAINALKFQLENKTGQRNGCEDDLEAALRVIKLLSGANHGE
jgi:uncharacterized coiled-coil protein SlyX